METKWHDFDIDLSGPFGKHLYIDGQDMTRGCVGVSVSKESMGEPVTITAKWLSTNVHVAGDHALLNKETEDKPGQLRKRGLLLLLSLGIAGLGFALGRLL